ncbi:hypothetical protein HY413_04030 [Candidatus Kaiserbacteria bacterium]|nr:hypothetical protein [Candidatus Kaiserbacteria bacterium]
MHPFVKEVMQTVTKDPEYADVVSKILWKFHQALVRQGFSRVEATKIVATQGLRLVAVGD